MMNTEHYSRLGRRLRHLVLGLTLALGSLPLAAMEELSVDGTREAAQKRAEQELFRAQMEAYSQAVDREFKGLLKLELERSIRAEPRLAAIDARSRG